MTVHVDRRADIVTITLDRPDKLNAMTDPMWQELDSALRDIGSARVLVLTGAGGAFCAGSDVGGLLGADTPMGDRIRLMNRVVHRLHELPIPTVARVDGVAAGAGANLALLCDFVLASDRSRFMELFIRRALSLDSGASWLLPRLVGDRRARELAMLGDTVGAADARRYGLINRVVPVDDLDAEVDALTERLARLPAAALRGTKQLLLASWDSTLAEALEAETVNQLAVLDTPETQETITGFGRETAGPPRGDDRR
ncbi:MAG TPA: enoyl-CoA hydratase-related protein [Pseudonocardiaceae bacterium]|nr:enoyl-CoA hydratase-related protein [Pseudonocardiaceae bacterium]